MQQIIAQLLFRGDPNLSVAEMSPWLDLRVPPKAVKLPMVEAQTHRRFLKTHLPVDAIRFSPQAKYLYIGRDARGGRWADTLTEQDSAEYLSRAKAELGEACTRWLNTGEGID